MSGYLLDTNVVSEATKPQRHAGLTAFLEAHSLHDMHLSIMTVGEIELGITLAGDTRRARDLRSWLDARLLPDYRGRVLPVDLSVVTEWGRLMALPAARARTGVAVDALIAATASVHRLTLVTRNVADFAPFPVAVYDPWTHPQPG